MMTAADSPADRPGSDGPAPEQQRLLDAICTELRLTDSSRELLSSVSARTLRVLSSTMHRDLNSRGLIHGLLDAARRQPEHVAANFLTATIHAAGDYRSLKEGESGALHWSVSAGADFSKLWRNLFFGQLEEMTEDRISLFKAHVIADALGFSPNAEDRIPHDYYAAAEQIKTALPRIEAMLPVLAAVAAAEDYEPQWGTVRDAVAAAAESGLAPHEVAAVLRERGTADVRLAAELLQQSTAPAVRSGAL